MKPKFKVGDIVRILPGYREDPDMKEEDAIREIIYCDEWDEVLPYQLDGDDELRLKWWGDDMLEPYESESEHRNLSQETANCDKFTLTPEEVETVRKALMTEKNVIIDVYVHHPAVESYLIKHRDLINNLLTRIKQWQNEH